jgi:hypothetical protein
MKKILLVVMVLLIVGFGAIQLVPVQRTNPTVESDIPTSPEIKAILRKACYDCHSNETRWPWYSYIAPVSWLTVYDTNKGREELNFSTWNRYDTEKQGDIIKDLWETVEDGEMPPWFYTVPHPEARLSVGQVYTPKILKTEPHLKVLPLIASFTID